MARRRPVGIERNQGTGTLSGMQVSTIATGAAGIFEDARRGVSELAEIHRRREMARGQTWASNEISALSDTVDARFQEAMRDAAEDGSDLLDVYDGVYQEALAEATGRAPNNHARSVFGEKALRFNAASRQRVRAHAAGMEAGYMAGEIERKTDRASIDIFNSPGALEYHLDELNDDIASHREYGAIGGAALDKLEAQTRARYAEAAINGEIERDPKVALDAMQSGVYDDLLADADRKNVMMARAKSALDSRASAAATAVKGLARDAQAAIYAGDGDQLAPGELRRLSEMLEGTTEGADLLRAMSVSAELAGIKKLPAHELEALLADAGTRQNLSVAALETRKAAVSIAQRTLSEQGNAKDGFGSFHESVYGRAPDPLFTILPNGQKALDIGAESWSRRVSDRYVRWREAMEHTANPNLLPFTRSELGLIEQLMLQSDTLGEDMMVSTMESLGFDELKPHELNQIAGALGENNPTLGIAVAYTPTDPALASDILQGASMAKELSFSAAAGFTIPGEYAAAYQMSRKGLYDAEKAARALYARRHDPANENFQADVWLKAWADVAGGQPINWRNDTLVLSPNADREAPMSSMQFDAVMRSLTDESLVEYGVYIGPSGQEYALEAAPVIDPAIDGVPVEPLTAETLLSEGTLISYAAGRYLVKIGTGVAKQGVDSETSRSLTYALDLGRYVRDNGVPEARPLPPRESGELPYPRFR